MKEAINFAVFDGGRVAIKYEAVLRDDPELGRGWYAVLEKNEANRGKEEIIGPFKSEDELDRKMARLTRALQNVAGAR